MAHFWKGMLAPVGLAVLLPDVWAQAGTSWVARRDQRALQEELHDRAPQALIGVQAAAAEDAPPPVRFLEPAKPQAGDPVGTLRIPALELERIFVEGIEFDHLHGGLGHHPRTPLPGEAGNTVVVGHPSLFGAPFRFLGSMEPGDQIHIATGWGDFSYEVVDGFTADRGDRTVVEATIGPVLTLVEWVPPLGPLVRQVVRARLADVSTGAVPAFEASSPDPVVAEAEPESPPLPALPGLYARQVGGRRTVESQSSAPEVVHDAPAPPEPGFAPPEPLPEPEPPPEEETLLPPLSGPVDPPATPPPSGNVQSGRGGGGDDASTKALEQPDLTEEVSPAPSPRPVDSSAPACRDGNDGDGLVDFRAPDGTRRDRQCNGENDEEE